MSALFSQLVDTFGLIQVTMWAISVFSTLTERLLLFLVCAAVLLLAERGSRVLASAVKGVIARAGIAFLCFAVLYQVFPFTEYPFPVDGYAFPGDHPIAAALALSLGVAILASWKPGLIWTPAIVASLTAVLLLNGWALRDLARRLHADPAVVQFAAGDFNWIELNPPARTLYAAGHGTPHLLAFDTASPAHDPRRSPVDVGGPQSFAFNPEDQELYVVNLDTQILHVLDAASLAIYDLKSRAFTAHFPIEGRYIERIVSRPDRKEVLVAAPVQGAVLRLDADTLAMKGSFAALPGVRTLALDEVHNLLFAGGLILNTLEVIDLATETRIADFYVGPWLRTIALDPAAGMAYVSSIEGLFRVDYRDVLRARLRGDE